MTDPVRSRQSTEPAVNTLHRSGYQHTDDTKTLSKGTVDTLPKYLQSVKNDEHTVNSKDYQKTLMAQTDNYA